jgi:hypothetical protein
MSFNFSTESTLDGSGQLVAGDAYYDIPTGSMSDATIKVRWTPPAVFTGDLLLFFRADAASGVPFNTDATALFMQGGQTIALQDRGPANSNDGNLATAGTAVAGTPIDAWIRLDGARCRVWLDGNTGTPDMDTSSMSRTTGHAGLRIVGGTSSIDYIEFDDVASSPGGGAVDEIIAPVSMGAVPDWWRTQLATWQQLSGSRRAPIAADVIPPADQIAPVVLNVGADWWANQLARWQQLAGGVIAPLADDLAAGGSGDAVGVVVFTGAATGTLPNEGAATGAAVFTGAATGALRNEGDATGAVVFGGSATGEQNATNSGDATGVALFTGSATGVLRNDGAATGSALFTGSAAGTLLVQGNATGALQLTGVATGRLAVQGAGSGVAVFTGAAAGAQEPPGAGGTAIGVVVFTGAASGALRLAGSASGVVVFRGNAGGIDPDPGGGGSSGRMRRRGVRTPLQFVQ